MAEIEAVRVGFIEPFLDRVSYGGRGTDSDRALAERDPFHQVAQPPVGVPESFAGDVPAEQAAFMADSHVPWEVDALGGTITEPAWRGKPSWVPAPTEDKVMPPPAQRSTSVGAGAVVTEAAASHSV
jgi:hypothetical protein